MPKVVHDPAARKFFISLVPNETAEVAYHREGDLLDLTHTAVPASRRNQGWAEKVVEAAFLYAQKEGLKIRPSCSYISSTFIKKRTDLLNLIES